MKNKRRLKKSLKLIKKGKMSKSVRDMLVQEAYLHYMQNTFKK